MVLNLNSVFHVMCILLVWCGGAQGTGYASLVVVLQDVVLHKFKSYPEGVGHLPLPVHRHQQLEVAGDPSGGQREDGCVVVHGNLQHGVFSLQKHTDVQKKTCYHGDVGLL